MSLRAPRDANPDVTLERGDITPFSGRRFRAVAAVPDPFGCRLVVGWGSSRALAYRDLAQRLRDEIADGAS